MPKVKISEDMDFVLNRDIKDWKLKSFIGDVEKVLDVTGKGNKKVETTRYVLIMAPKFKQILKESEYKEIMEFNNIVDVTATASNVEDTDNSNDKNLDDLLLMSKEELLVEALKYYKEGELDKRLGKNKLIELISEAR